VLADTREYYLAILRFNVNAQETSQIPARSSRKVYAVSHVVPQSPIAAVAYAQVGSQQQTMDHHENDPNNKVRLCGYQARGYGNMDCSVE